MDSCGGGKMKRDRYDIDLKGKTLELGCGEHPISNGDLMDKRHDIFVGNRLKIFDLEQTSYPLDSDAYDTIVGLYVLEHISWPRYKGGFFQKELFRVMKPGGKAIFLIPNTLQQIAHITTCKEHPPISFEHIETLFGSQDYPENSHKMGFDVSKFTLDLFEPYGFKVNVIAPMPDVYVGDRIIYPHCATDMILELTKPLTFSARDFIKTEKKECLNLGSFSVMIKDEKENWTNIDIIDDYRTRGKAEREGYKFLAHDVRKPLPFEVDSIDMINESHLIEHLTREEGLLHLQDCYRILKPNGILRVGTPDLNKFIEAYKNDNMDLFDKDQPEIYRNQTPAEKFWRIVTSGPPDHIGTPYWEGHKTIYTPDDLIKILKHIGFEKVYQDEYNKKYDMFPDESAYVLAIKGDGFYHTLASKNVVMKDNRPVKITEVKYAKY